MPTLKFQFSPFITPCYLQSSLFSCAGFHYSSVHCCIFFIFEEIQNDSLWLVHVTYNLASDWLFWSSSYIRKNTTVYTQVVVVCREDLKLQSQVPREYEQWLYCQVFCSLYNLSVGTENRCSTSVYNLEK